jgi:hypothetical protein
MAISHAMHTKLKKFKTILNLYKNNHINTLSLSRSSQKHYIHYIGQLVFKNYYRTNG